jgi:hypothetical protein
MKERGVAGISTSSMSFRIKKAGAGYPDSSSSIRVKISLGEND